MVQALSLDTGVTIPEVARRSGAPERTVRELLREMHRQDEADGKPTWMYRVGPRKWRVNLEVLRQVRPFVVRECEVDAGDVVGE